MDHNKIDKYLFERPRAKYSRYLLLSPEWHSSFYSFKVRQTFVYSVYRYCTKDFLVELFDLSIVFHVWGGIDKCLSIQAKGLEIFAYGNEEKYKQVVVISLFSKK